MTFGGKNILYLFDLFARTNAAKGQVVVNWLIVYEQKTKCFVNHM